MKMRWNKARKKSHCQLGEALLAEARAVRKQMGANKVGIMRDAPPCSHQSQGAVECEHAKITGLMRTLLMNVHRACFLGWCG